MVRRRRLRRRVFTFDAGLRKANHSTFSPGWFLAARWTATGEIVGRGDETHGENP
jgi:hypothetical protein